MAAFPAKRLPGSKAVFHFFRGPLLTKTALVVFLSIDSFLSALSGFVLSDAKVRLFSVMAAFPGR